jgi:hypothetical protein
VRQSSGIEALTGQPNRQGGQKVPAMAVDRHLDRLRTRQRRRGGSSKQSLARSLHLHELAKANFSCEAKWLGNSDSNLDWISSP